MAPLDPTDLRLLDEFQRDFPLVPRPFGVLGRALGLSEGDVLARLSHLRLQGMIARVGATVRPNTAGASTLAALKVPPPRLEAVAAQVGAETGVNHSYAREDDWNLWFVATAPDQAALACQLDRIRAATALPLLDLRLVRAFNIDLGFCLNGRPQPMGPDRKPKDRVLRPADRPLLHELVQGLDLVPAPYAALARQLGRDEAETVARIAQLAEARIISRLGIIGAAPAARLDRECHDRLGFARSACGASGRSAGATCRRHALLSAQPRAGGLALRPLRDDPWPKPE